MGIRDPNTRCCSSLVNEALRFDAIPLVPDRFVEFVPDGFTDSRTKRRLCVRQGSCGLGKLGVLFQDKTFLFLLLRAAGVACELVLGHRVRHPLWRCIHGFLRVHCVALSFAQNLPNPLSLISHHFSNLPQ